MISGEDTLIQRIAILISICEKAFLLTDWNLHFQTTLTDVQGACKLQVPSVNHYFHDWLINGWNRSQIVGYFTSETDSNLLHGWAEAM